MKILNILLITTIITILALSGWINEETAEINSYSENQTDEQQVNESNNKSNTVTTYPITITDNLKRSVTINQEPQRIISLSPAHTEILFALGLGDKIVGVTNYCNYPEEASSKPVVSEFKTIDIELIINSAPDLVLMTSGVQSFDQLDNLGITLIAFDAKTVDEVLENIKLIGQVTNKKEESEELIDDLNNKINSVKSTAGNMSSKPKIFYIIWDDPLWTIGPDAFIEDAIEITGGNNIFSYDLPRGAPTDYFTTSMEAVITRNPDIIIIDSHNNDAMNTTQNIKNNSQWRSINAVQNNRIYVMDADVASRAGPRIVDAMDMYSGWFVNWSVASG